MTPEQRAKLQELIDDVETKYVEFISPDTPIHQLSHFKAVETEIFAYVDGLIAANDKSTLLNRLWASSTGLLDRFNAQPSVKQAADRMMSEVLELVIAAHDTYGASTDDAAEEAADVVVTAINVLRAACVTQEQFTAALETIIAKNDKKSHDDYELIVKTQGVEKRAAKAQS